jgi:hypothetical protein
MGSVQHGPSATHLYFPVGTVAAQPVVAPVDDGVAAQRNLDRFFWILLYSLFTLFHKPILVIRVQVVFFIKTCMVLGSLLWDMIDGPGSGQAQAQAQAGTAEAPRHTSPGTVEDQAAQV